MTSLAPSLFALLLATAQTPFTSSAIWRPNPDFRSKVLAACTNHGAKFDTCFADQMKLAGASPEAVAFARSLDNGAYMQAFRSTGTVSIAQLESPFRANDNESLYLLNGDPPTIDVDDFARLPMDEMKSDSAYQAMSKDHSDATLFPGDRSSVNNLLAMTRADGSLDFVAAYRVQAGCHACAVLGQAFFSFHFAASGKFEAAHFAGFTTKYEPSAKYGNMVVSLQPGEKLTLLLPSNPATGYSWQLRPPPSPASNVVVLGHSNSSPEHKLLGAGGEEHWMLQTKGPGESTLDFTYARPWEKNTNNANQLSLTFRVRP